MNNLQATALATRLAEAVYHPSPTVVAQEWYFRIILPLLQAQALEDEKGKQKWDKWGDETIHTIANLELDVSALRALVGRMKHELKQIAKDAGDNLDRSGVYTSDRIWKVAEDAKKCLGE